MAANHGDLHGNVPDKSGVALLLIDVINDFEFEGAEEIFDAALEASERIADLKRRAKAEGIPVIYTNDNFGRWQSDFARLVERCRDQPVRGQPIVRRLLAEPDDYFVLKPSYSAFFATPLDLLLQALQANCLILVGYAGNMCILFTANDAFMRNLSLVIPSDCIASNSRDDDQYTLRHASRVLGALVSRSAEIDLDRLQAEALERGREAEKGSG